MPQSNDIIKVISMKKGRFIVLDGVDGSGKGTQLAKLAEFIFRTDKSKQVVLTREPFKYNLEIRKILKKEKKPQAQSEKLTRLFVKDRIFHTSVIKKLTLLGFDVVCDRYKYSTLAYQQTQGIPLAKLLEMHKGILLPDLAIIIDIPVRAVLARIHKDLNRKFKEMFEQEEFQEKLRQNFLALPKQLPDEKIVIIDGNRSPEKVFELIKKEVDTIL